MGAGDRRMRAAVVARWIWIIFAGLLLIGCLTDNMVMAALLFGLSVLIALPPLGSVWSRYGLGGGRQTGAIWATGIAAFVLFGATAKPTSLANPNATSLPIAVDGTTATERPDPKVTAYMDRVRKELASLNKPDDFDPTEWNSRAGLILQGGLTAAYAAVYHEGSRLDLSRADQAERQNLKAAIIKSQQRRFPQLRSLMAAFLRKESKGAIQVETGGVANRTLILRASMANSNAASDAFINNFGDSASLLRFDKIQFQGTDESEPLEHNVNSLADDVIATLDGDNWHPVD